MEFYVKKDKTGKKGTRVGLKIDKAAATAIGSTAVLLYNKFNRDQDLKDAASKYILKSVEYNTKAEETQDPELKKEYKKKAEEYEHKAKEISTLISKRQKAIKDKNVKESMNAMKARINDAYENKEITEEVRDELLEYADIENYNYDNEFIESLLND